MVPTLLLGLSKQDMISAVAAFVVPELEVFLPTPVYLSTSFFVVGGKASFCSRPLTEAWCVLIVWVQTATRALQAVVEAPTVVVCCQSLENKKGEGTTASRKAVLFAWSTSSLQTDARQKFHTFQVARTFFFCYAWHLLCSVWIAL